MTTNIRIFSGSVSVRTFGWTPASALYFMRLEPMPPELPASRRGEGGSARLRIWFRCPVGAGRKRRHLGEATEDDKGDGMPDLFLKLPDAFLATYII
jgi:hypothetical protein